MWKEKLTRMRNFLKKKREREKQREKEAASSRGEKDRVRQLEPEKCVGGIKSDVDLRATR